MVVSRILVVAALAAACWALIAAAFIALGPRTGLAVATAWAGAGLWAVAWPQPARHDR